LQDLCYRSNGRNYWSNTAEISLPERLPLVAFCGQSRELKKVSIDVHDLARLGSLHMTSFTALIAGLASSVERSTVRSGAVA
jgi:hypothetical protein